MIIIINIDCRAKYLDLKKLYLEYCGLFTQFGYLKLADYHIGIHFKWLLQWPCFWNYASYFIQFWQRMWVIWQQNAGITPMLIRIFTIFDGKWSHIDNKTVSQKKVEKIPRYGGMLQHGGVRLCISNVYLTIKMQ